MILVKIQNINHASYSNKSVARYWASYSDNLLYGEQLILQSLHGQLACADFADIGVGGGRTTGHLADKVRSYTGIDYSQPLVEACRKKYPNVDFHCLDVCESLSLGESSYDFIFFSFNGIDCLTQAERDSFLKNAFVSLRPGGRLLFSSHNYFKASLPMRTREALMKLLMQSVAAPYKPRALYHGVLSFIRYCRLKHHQRVADDFASLLDAAQGNRELLAWIDPVRQINDLECHGFNANAITVFDWYGVLVPASHLRRIDTYSVYYLCQKSGSA